MRNLVIRNSIPIAGLALTLLAPFSSISIRQTGAQQLTRRHTDDSLGSYVAQAVPVEPGQTPRLDGRLDDPIWRTAPPARGFVQNEPDYGAPATEDTEVRFCYDRENLYVGARCYDSDPGRIIKRLSYRELDMYSSDTFAVFFDSRHDHRTGVKFGTNPLGMREDSFRYNDYQRDNTWDGVWWVKTFIDSLGWTAEFKIPFKNFRFADRPEQVWGLNLQRNIQRTNETTFWKPIDRDDGVVLRMSKLGHLMGIRRIRPGRHFEFIPFAAQGTTQGLGTGLNNRTDGGLDVKYAITPNLTADATLNPDFAQVEADLDEINLTRFPTRFPEQRPFFVEGNNAFLTPLEVFFSRRIGSRGDLLWGTKVTGKSGPYTIGLLGAQTGDWTYFGLQDRASGKEDATYGIARLKRDVLGNSNIGLLFGDKGFNGQHNRVVGADFSLRPGRVYFLNGQVAASRSPGFNARNLACLVDFTRRTDRSQISFSFTRLEPNFEMNETGFLRKERFRGSQQTRLDLTYSPRPRALNLRQVFLTGWVDADQPLPTDRYLLEQSRTDPDLIVAPGFVAARTGVGAGGSLSLKFQEGSGVTLFGSRQRRYDLTGALFVDSLGVRLQTDTRRWVSVALNGIADDFYNFQRRHVSREYALSLDATLKPGDRTTVEARLRHSRAFDPQNVLEGKFWLGAVRAIYLFSPDLFLRVLVQARLDQTQLDNDRRQKTYLISSVFAWEFIRGSRLFIAYNESRDNAARHFRLTNQALVIKLAHLIDL